MLVLSRQKNERIAINGGAARGGVDFFIIEIRGDNVRLGINAPRDITVHRGEVQDEIDRQAILDRAVRQQEEGLPEGNPPPPAE